MKLEEPIIDHADYVERLVAFVDILGFRRYVFEAKDKAKETIRLIDEVLSHAVSIVKDQNVESLFSLKLFSDCICMSTDPSNAYEMLYELAFIQGWFSINGIFLRGALSRGLHYENKNMIFSEGLVKAYEQEKNAIYPRITIDPMVFDPILNSDASDFLLKAPDGVVFVDYLNFFLVEEVPDRQELFEKHKVAVVEQVKRNAGNNAVVEKYRWLADYHNIKAAEYLGAPDDWEDSYYDELQATLSIPIGEHFPSFEKPKNDEPP